MPFNALVALLLSVSRSYLALFALILEGALRDMVFSSLRLLFIGSQRCLRLILHINYVLSLKRKGSG
jgi:hypothetical protein